jgi:hypothetical protein
MTSEFDTLYGSKYLAASDLDGTVLRVKIGKVELASLRQKDGTALKKYALSFPDQNKAMVLNMTNARRLAEAFGKKANEWVGKTVEIYAEDTSFGPGLRLRAIKVQKPIAEDLSDQIPVL